MIDRENNHDNVSFDNPEPTWIEHLLEICSSDSDLGVSPYFAKKSREAAANIVGLRSMRSAAERIGFEPVPLSQYFERLAYAAGTQLQPLLRLMDQSDDSSAAALVDRSTALVRLAANIGMSLRQFLVHHKLSHMMRAGVPIAQFSKLRAEPISSEVLLRTVTEELRGMHRELDAKSAKELRDSEARVRYLYKLHADIV